MDPATTEVVINRPGEVAIEGQGGWRWHDVPELTATALGHLAVAAAAFTAQHLGRLAVVGDVVDRIGYPSDQRRQPVRLVSGRCRDRV